MKRLEGAKRHPYLEILVETDEVRGLEWQAEEVGEWEPEPSVSEHWNSVTS